MKEDQERIFDCNTLNGRVARASDCNAYIGKDKYTIKNVLSAGGVSIVYEAVRTDADNKASKEILKEFFPAEGARRENGEVVDAEDGTFSPGEFEMLQKDFFDEELRIGAIAREKCTQVYSLNTVGNGMASIHPLSDDAKSLEEKLIQLERKPPAAEEGYLDLRRLRFTVEVIYSILCGLIKIHGQHILHLDLNLNNIFWVSNQDEYKYGDGTAYFLDFGCAVQMNDKNVAAEGSVRRRFGTYSFSAPEVISGNYELTPAADIFSVAALFVVLLLGKKATLEEWKLANPEYQDELYRNESFDICVQLEQSLEVPEYFIADIEEILVRGLNENPEKRFEKSAQKMLDVVIELRNKCSPDYEFFEKDCDRLARVIPAARGSNLFDPLNYNIRC